MKALSLWQPYASLAIYEFKGWETRGWPGHSLVGQRIGIASTKNIKGDQRRLYNAPLFQRYYRETCLPELDELPCGTMLGTVEVAACVPMTRELIRQMTRREIVFGDWQPGRYGFLLRDPRPFPEPIPVSGKQGIWDWHEEVDQGHTLQAGKAPLRRDLHAG